MGEIFCSMHMFHLQPKGGSRNDITIQTFTQSHYNHVYHGSNYFHDSVCPNSNPIDCEWQHTDTQDNGRWSRERTIGK